MYRFNFTFPILHDLTLPIEIETWNAFNSRGQISQYDATFKWWQWTVDYLLSTAAAANHMTLPQITSFATQKIASSVCETAMTYCNDSVVSDTANLYSSQKECEGFLTAKVRFGEAYELGMFPQSRHLSLYTWIGDADLMLNAGRNTLLCRMVHQNMVPFRPAVHCPHIGPTGGGYCNDDMSYAETVTDGYFTHFPFAHGGAMTG